MATTYPLPKFHFRVSFGDSEFNCTEVSGLDFEREMIEYRAGADNEYHKTKQPGLSKYSNITIKRGTFVETNKEFYEPVGKNRVFSRRRRAVPRRP